MERIRVAMIGTKGMPATIGGVERHVEALSQRLVAGGFSVTVYGRSWYLDRHPGTERTYRGVRVVVLQSVRTKHLDAISHTFLATLHAMRERADVYHFHGVGPALLAWMPRVFRPRSTVFVTFHSVDRLHAKWGIVARAMLTIGEWAACTFPHETIAVGEVLTAYCTARYGAHPVCIANGVAEPSPAARSRAAQDMLRSHGITPKRYLFVASRLVAHKEIHTVIRAFRQLRRERPDLGGIQLVIAGSPTFTEQYEEELRVAASGDPAVLFLGQRSGLMLEALFANALAFVHASRSEGLPLAVLEAAAAGTMPIVSDIPEHREVIARIGGMLFETGNMWDLLCKLEVALSGAAHLARIGGDAQRAVLRHYHWDRIAVCTAERYRAHTVNRYARVHALSPRLVRSAV
ncbi:MAG: glycosyltransferase family 4 protein [bacterium]|nr:glycosyltransferase family 4 protein [bacterium]